MRNTDGPTKLATLIAVGALTASSLLTPSVVGATAEAAPNANHASQQLNSGSWLDTQNRQAVIDSYAVEFNRAEPDIGWTGNHDICDVGTTNPAYRTSIFQRINWYRSMAGLPPVTENADLSTQAQQAVLTSSLAPELSHEPPVSTPCFTQAAFDASEKSNLFKGRTGVRAIDGYVLDFGPGNVSVGHRNWLLSPTAQEFGVGDAAIEGQPSSNVLYLDEVEPIGSATSPDIRQPNGSVAWPAAGYTPASVVYQRWSFSLRGADLSAATVTTQQYVNGSPVNVSSPVLHKGAGTPSEIIVWEPELDYPADADGKTSLPQPEFDQTYRITIDNVLDGDGQTRSYTYDVTVIGEQEAPRPAQVSAAVPQGPTDTLDPTSELTPVPSADFASDQLDRLYSAYFLRGADDSGLDYWLSQLAEGAMTVPQVSEEFAQSPEFNAMYGSLDDTDFVKLVYDNVLDRNADAAGLAYWTDQIADGLSRGEMMAAFADSPENVARTGGSTPLTPTASKVWRLYAAVFSRVPDPEGISFWTGQLNQRDLGAIAENFAQSPEFVETHGTLSDQQFVTLLYQSVLGREPDAGGLSHWEAQLQHGKARGEVVLAFSNSPEFVRNSGTIY